MIPFTQYLRPDGRERAVEVDMPLPIEHLAFTFIKAGGRYECEELRTGSVVFTAVYGDDDIAMEICQNGPDVPYAVEMIVRKSIAFLDRL
jgi:hypothetical protein